MGWFGIGNNDEKRDVNDEYQRPPGPPPNGQYGRPQGPPPGNYQNQDGYNDSRGGYERNDRRYDDNENSGYQRTAAPLPNSNGHDMHCPTGVDHAHEGGQYSRPNGAPPANYVQPTNMQQVPHHTQSIDGVENAQYQYSQCTGKRKALIIGINYINTKNQLNGCINDAHNIHDFLVRQHGYNPDDIVMLTDDQTMMAKVPTRANMLRAMGWLVKNAQPNDSLFFHYSGHGGQVEDKDGDEEDGLDDVIYPIDFESQGPIIDDEMHDIMVKPLAKGVRLTALFDSCHSGTVLDLAYTYSTKGVIKEPSIWKDVGATGLQAAMAYASGNRQMLLTSLGSMVTTVKNGMGNNVDREKVREIKFSPADIIMLSGSKDNQTSADSKVNGLATGAMSYAFVKVMTTQPQQSYLSLLQNMRSEMATKYTQKPQLSASHPIDVNLQFLI